MYFDNYLKNNPNFHSHNYQTNNFSTYNPHPIPNLDHTPSNNKGYFNSKCAQYPPDNRVIPVRNFPEMPYQSKIAQVNQGGYAAGSNLISYQMQTNNNNTSFNQEISNISTSGQNNQYLKRRDSIYFNNMYKQNQAHSPSTKNYTTQNMISNQFSRTKITNQTVKNVQQQTNLKNQNLNNNLNKSTNNLIKNINDNHGKPTKNLSQQKFLHKIGYNKNSNNDNNISLNGGQNKNNLKNTSYLSGYTNVGKNQNYQQIQKRRKQTYHAKNDNRQKYAQNFNDFMYNFQLKNIALDFNSTSSNYKDNKEIKHKQGSEFKYYTPHLLKQKSQKEEFLNLGKQQFSRISQKIDSQRQAILTDRQVYKSPSHNDLFQSVYNDKQCVKNKSINTQLNNKNINDDAHKVNISHKNQSQTLIGSNNLFGNQQQNLQQKSTKNYHALIQNLQKKFSQQKRSFQGFQAKQKYYLAQISKKEEKLKRLQNIIENNKQMTLAKDQTIKQLRNKLQNQSLMKRLQNQSILKKQELGNTADSANLKDLQIQQLKKQNCNLKQQLKKLKKKSQFSARNESNIQNSNIYNVQKYENKIKQLQKQIIQLKQQKQTYSIQIGKLRQSNSNIHQSYNIEIKQHQKLKQENAELKKYIQQLQQNLHKTKQSLNQLQVKYNQSIQQIKKVRQKSQTLLVNQNTCLHQEYQLKLERDKKVYKQRFQLEKKQLSQNYKIQIQKLKIKLQRCEAQVNFKSSKIKDLQNKIANDSCQLYNKSKKQIKQGVQATLEIKSEMAQIYIQQLTTLRQKLKRKQQVNEQLAQQLKNKTRVLERMLFQKVQLQGKLQKLQNKVKSLKSINQNQQSIIQQISNQKPSKTAQQFTFSSQSKCEIQRKKCEILKDKQIQDVKSLLNCYHAKYRQIALLFNLNQSQKQKQNYDLEPSSLTSMPHEDVQQISSELQTITLPSQDYINTMHPLIKDQIQKILKDIKKLVSVLKQSQNEIQQRNQKLHQMDKNIKKQAAKINGLMGEIHMKNITIIEINKMQIEKDILRLNEKYEILGNMDLNSII